MIVLITKKTAEKMDDDELTELIVGEYIQSVGTKGKPEVAKREGSRPLEDFYSLSPSLRRTEQRVERLLPVLNGMVEREGLGRLPETEEPDLSHVLNTYMHLYDAPETKEEGRMLFGELKGIVSNTRRDQREWFVVSSRKEIEEEAIEVLNMVYNTLFTPEGKGVGNERQAEEFDELMPMEIVGLHEFYNKTVEEGIDMRESKAERRRDNDEFKKKLASILKPGFDKMSDVQLRRFISALEFLAEEAGRETERSVRDSSDWRK